jgi:hypothetical protein
MLKETTNNVFIAGQLVKKNLEIKDIDVKDKTGNVTGKEKAITGDLIIRTADGSEHEVSYFAKQMKKDGSGENSIFKGLQTVMNEYKSLEQFPNEADIIKIGSGQFNVQDYKGQDGEVKTYNGVRANFANRLTPNEIETTPLESKFEVEGIITKTAEEIYKNEPTGNVKVSVNILGYEGTIIPVVLTVPQAIAEPFMGAGFFEGGFAKFAGKLINTKETVEVVEKMAFGADNVKVVTTTVNRKEITGGNPMGMPIEHEIDEQEYEQAKSKRKLKLDKIKNEVKGGNSTSQTPPVSNPFATSGANTSNPFNPFAGK